MGVTPEHIASDFAPRLDCVIALTAPPPGEPLPPILSRTLALVPRCASLRELALWSGREQARRTARFWEIWQELIERDLVSVAALDAPEERMRWGLIPKFQAAGVVYGRRTNPRLRKAS